MLKSSKAHPLVSPTVWRLLSEKEITYCRELVGSRLLSYPTLSEFRIVHKCLESLQSNSKPRGQLKRTDAPNLYVSNMFLLHPNVLYPLLLHCIIIYLINQHLLLLLNDVRFMSRDSDWSSYINSILQGKPLYSGRLSRYFYYIYSFIDPQSQTKQTSCISSTRKVKAIIIDKMLPSAERQGANRDRADDVCICVETGGDCNEDVTSGNKNSEHQLLMPAMCQ